MTPERKSELVACGGGAAAAFAGGLLGSVVDVPAAAAAALCGLPIAAAATAAGGRPVVAAAGAGLVSAAMFGRDWPDLSAVALIAAASAGATLALVSDRRRAIDRRTAGAEKLHERILADATARTAAPEPERSTEEIPAATLATLQEAGRRISTHLDPESVVPAVVTTARSVLGCRDAVVYFWDKRTGALSDAFPARARDTGRYAPDPDRGMTKWVLDHRQPLLREAVEADFVMTAAVGPEPRRPAAIAPLLAGYELLGLLVVDDVERSDAEFGRLLPLVANLAALGLKNAQLSRRIDETARRDALTGLLHRGAFEADLQELLEGSDKDAPLTVLFADFDRFKELNEGHGHPAGDAVLQEAARLWRAALPDDAVVGRFGGEEFVAALPGCDLARGAELAESVREAVASHPFAHEGRPVAVTLSVGLAESGPHATADRLIRQADVALRQAKAAGRNRVRSAEPIDA